MAKVYLNPGHGDDDPGACAFGRSEAKEVLEVALAVGPILQANGIEVAYTRTTDGGSDAHMVNYVPKVNREGCDFFVSIHRNASGAGASGYETCVYSNQGYSQIFADKMNAGMADLGYNNRGTKIRTDLYVLNSTSMPAALVELGFIDSEKDNYLFDSRWDDMISLIAHSIMEALGVNGNVPVPDVPETENETEEISMPKGTNAMGQSGPNPQGVYSGEYDPSVQQLQAVLNSGAGAELLEDGIAGPVTYNALQQFTIESGDTGELIQWMQNRLNILGFNAGAEDGQAGEKTMAAIARFQEHYGLDIGYLSGTDWYYAIES